MIMMAHNYFPLAYDYQKMEQYKAKNETKLPDHTYDILHEECHEIMKKDVAIVKVRMESGKYIRTIMDKKMTFADKLAAFGIIIS